MVVERALRGEGVIDAIAEGVTQLVLGHAAMQRQRSDEVNIIDTGCCGHIENLLDDALPNVGFRMEGSGNEMSSKAIVSFMPGLSSSGKGSSSIGSSSADESPLRVGRPGAARLGRSPGCDRLGVFEPEVVAVGNSSGGVCLSTSRTKPGRGERFRGQMPWKLQGAQPAAPLHGGNSLLAQGSAQGARPDRNGAVGGAVGLGPVLDQPPTTTGDGGELGLGVDGDGEPDGLSIGRSDVESA